MFFSISKWFLLLVSLITVCACSTVEKNTVPSTTPLLLHQPILLIRVQERQSQLMRY